MLEANYFSTPLPPPGHCLKVRSLLSSQYRFISTIVFGKIMKYSYKQVNVLKEMFYSRKWVYHLISINYEAGLTFCRIVSQVAVEQRKRRKNSGWRSDIYPLNSHKARLLNMMDKGDWRSPNSLYFVLLIHCWWVV